MLSCKADAETADSLGLVLRHLAGSGYRFITPTPATHQRVLAHRGDRMAATLRDVFGWNMPFKVATCDGMSRPLLAAMRGAGVLQTRGDAMQSRVRVSSVGDDLFVHSAHPSTQDNAVILGPDTYRFARFIQQGLATGYSPVGQPLRLLDVGCGSGAGGVVAARALSHVGSIEVCMNDINPLALQYTAVNTAFAGIPAKSALGNAFKAVKGQFDIIVSNPPYFYDTTQRAYRHGGERMGRALSVQIGEEALSHLAPGGRLLLYTGVAVEGGVDGFLADMRPLLADVNFDWSYSEIDPDVFGEELAQTAYRKIDRIAAVGLTVTRKTGACDAG